VSRSYSSRRDAAPLATVIIPTHDHASTLDLAVTSVLEQSVDALDVVIIGDGVGDDTRDVVATLLADPRVRFLDEPKSASRAELVRHRVLTEASAPYVSYLGDDDLMLADHMESMIDRLQEADFTHPLPMFVYPDGVLDLTAAADLVNPRCVAWHLHPGRNSISLTGAAHRLDAYLRLPFGWRETPPGIWSDHYMWQQWFVVPGIRLSTSDRLTVLRFPSAIRTGMGTEERRCELLEWRDRSRRPGFDVFLKAQKDASFQRHAIYYRLEFDALSDRSTEDREAWRQFERATMASGSDSEAELQPLQLRVERAVEAHQAARAAAARAEEAARAAESRADEALQAARRAQDELSATRATRTWRLHDWFIRHPAVQRLYSSARRDL
jgi:glycosyltransferase involved in cell wall biosynthesis